MLSTMKSKHQSFALVFLLSVLVLSGCAWKVKLVGPYDELVDNSVAQIQSDTISHFSKINAHKGEGAGSYASLKEFYPTVKGKVDALIVRAEVLENGLKKTPMTDNFRELKAQYDDLETLHQTPYSKEAMRSAQAAMDMSYRAIVKHLVYLKWNQERPQ